MGVTSVAVATLPLDRLPFDHRFTRALPCDAEPANRLRQVHRAA